MYKSPRFFQRAPDPYLRALFSAWEFLSADDLWAALYSPPLSSELGEERVIF